MNNYAYSAVTTKYQVTIPKNIRKLFPEISPFQKVSFFVRQNEIIIKPTKKLKDVIGILGKPPVNDKGLSLSEVRKIAYKKTKKK